MRDVEFSASRENIRSKWLMQGFCRRSSKRGLAEQTASTSLPAFIPLAPLSNNLLEKPLLRTKCQTFVGAIPSHESCRIRREHWPC